jgi:cyanate permease
MVISSALGPLPFGLGYDTFGGYTEVLLLMTALPLLGAVVVLFVRRPEKADSRRSVAGDDDS